MTHTRGKFITFEGIDGAGKSSHIASLGAFLEAAGKKVVLTREPGGTPLGEELRALLLHTPMSLEAETLLMFAARAEHVQTVIEPALLRGQWVLCDRFSDASFAYQGGGRGLAYNKLALLERWVHEATNPDLTFLFDLPTETAYARMSHQGREKDRFEAEQADFHKRVKEAYLQRAKEADRRIVVLEAQKEIAVLQEAIRQTVLKRLL